MTYCNRYINFDFSRLCSLRWYHTQVWWHSYWRYWIRIYIQLARGLIVIHLHSININRIIIFSWWAEFRYVWRDIFYIIIYCVLHFILLQTVYVRLIFSLFFYLVSKPLRFIYNISFHSLHNLKGKISNEAKK